MKNNKSNVYADQPCSRCGSKRRISKTWKESIATLSGSTLVECSQIVCTNKDCQLAFEENLAKETKKREIIRSQKEERDKLRKVNSLLHSKTSRGSSRI